jgi:homoserine/homoserine lactone efflux protein
MPLDLYLAFVLACVVLIVIPGPNVALIVATAWPMARASGC